MNVELLVLYAVVGAFILERGSKLYLKYKDGKIDLDDIIDIVEEVTDISEDAKEMIEDGTE
tara:strand:+ start:1810 stop:1992 length:183 start_codon:yes stop_codon:yes gene_type:complete